MFKFINDLSNTSVSIILMIISGLIFVVMHSTAKYLSNEIHIFEIAFLRCALVIVVLAPMIYNQGLETFITKQPKFQFFRILTNSIAMLCFFLRINFNNTITINSLKFNGPYFHNNFGSYIFKRKNKSKTSNRLINWFCWHSYSF